MEASLLNLKQSHTEQKTVLKRAQGKIRSFGHIDSRFNEKVAYKKVFKHLEKSKYTFRFLI